MATTEHYKNGSGTQSTTYDFTFPYLKQADIVVKVYESSAWATKAVTTDYTFPTATSIQFVTGKVPASGTNNIHIYRNTSSDSLAATFYPGSAIRSSDLNDNYTQTLYASEESAEKANAALENSRVYDSTSGEYTSAISKATDAVNTANDSVDDATAAKTATDTYVHDGTNLKGGGPPDGQPKGVKYAVDQAEDAVDKATDAETKAEAADEIADKALDATDTLVATKSGSTWTLQGGGTTAQDGSDPKGVKYAVEEAEDAVTNATTALNNSRESDGSGGYNSAIDIANEAKSTANAAETTATTAQNAVGNALLYTLKDNKTQFEAVIFDASDGHEAWEITDSTGISSSYTSFTDNGGSGTAKTVSGIPSGFTGDSGLSARFTYVHSSNTFTWSGYWVNDAETRYVVLGPATGSAPQSTSTTAANLPSGTTAQRPGTPVSGMFRYNTTEDEFEGYDGTEWGKVGGGLVTIDGGNFTLGTSLVHTTESYDGGSFN